MHCLRGPKCLESQSSIGCRLVGENCVAGFEMKIHSKHCICLSQVNFLRDRVENLIKCIVTEVPNVSKIRAHSDVVQWVKIELQNSYSINEFWISSVKFVSARVENLIECIVTGVPNVGKVRAQSDVVQWVQMAFQDLK